MSNPLTDFVDIADRWGTSLGSYELLIRSQFTHPETIGYLLLTEIPGYAAVVLASWAVALLSFIIDGVLLDTLTRVYQSVLNYVYSVPLLNPVTLAAFAMIVVIAKIYFDAQVRRDNSGAITAWRLGDATFSDTNDNQTFNKRLVTQVQSAFLLLVIIVFFVSNPFYVIGLLFSLVQWVADQIASGGGSATAGFAASASDTAAASSNSVLVDGFVAPVLQLINFQDILDDTCSQQWSQTLARGGGLDELSCLTDEQRAATLGSIGGLFLAVGGVVVVFTFVYFSWQCVKRGSWYVTLAFGYSAVLPWVAVRLLARPGAGRAHLDKLLRYFGNALTAAGWLAGILVIAKVGPTLLIMGVGATSGLPVVVRLAVAAALFYGAGWFVNHWYGKRVTRGADGRVIVSSATPGLSGWGDFFHNHRYGKPIGDAWDELRPHPQWPWARGNAETADDLAGPPAQSGSAMSTGWRRIIGRQRLALSPGGAATVDDEGLVRMDPEEEQIVKLASQTVQVVSSAHMPIVAIRTGLAQQLSPQRESRSGSDAGELELTLGPARRAQPALPPGPLAQEVGQRTPHPDRSAAGSAPDVADGARTEMRHGSTTEETVRAVSGPPAPAALTNDSQQPGTEGAGQLGRDHGPRHGRPDGTDHAVAGSSAATTPRPPVDRTEQMRRRAQELTAQYRRGLRDITSASAAVDDVAQAALSATPPATLTGRGGLAVEHTVARALHRHQQALHAERQAWESSSAQPANTPSAGNGVIEHLGGDGSFLEDEQAADQWQRTEQLARAMGVMVHAADTSDGPPLAVSVIDDDGHGRYRLSLRRTRGFGDTL